MTRQLKVDEAPLLIEAGLAPSVMVGAACAVLASAASAKVHSHVAAIPSLEDFMVSLPLSVWTGHGEDTARALEQRRALAIGDALDCFATTAHACSAECLSP